MSSSAFKNAAKSRRRSHKERHQPYARRKFGLLEKHKDYVLRARDYHRKQDQLKVLKEKASNRNPDEFYYKMVNTKLKNGQHFQPSTDNFTQEELKLMKSQDLTYTLMKRSQEAKKIDKLRSGLHLLKKEGGKRPNEHVFFVDSKKEEGEFEPSSHGEDYNNKSRAVDSEPLNLELDKATAASYKELKKRIGREKQLARIAEQQQLRKHLLEKGAKARKTTGNDGRVVYKWKKQRRR
ncbi:uncharacterized protein [Oscarella lobularis]|uniref:uncharacterized protein n=1 Tax=Oscarella lobularis TaxID=121494 RepID=UPI0033132D03